MSQAPIKYKLLLTKLHSPRIPSNMVQRTRLIEKFERDSQRPLSLVSAPTGFGKSILVAQWIEQSEQTSTWLSLDEKDNDLRLFLNYTLAAIEQIFPGECQSSKNLLKETQLPAPDEICTILIDDISQLPRHFILILDDYQLIKNEAIHSLIKELMRHPSPKMHLVIISRNDPPLPLIRYLSKNLMTLISTEALRFTCDETRDLLTKSIPGRFEEMVIEPLVNKMEGWITGITLTLLSLLEDQHLNAEMFLKVTPYYLQEYLTAEITKNIQPEIAQYILDCSVLDELCLPMVSNNNPIIKPDSVSGENGAAEFMLDLDKSHLLNNCANCNNHWCSLHPLFKDFLQSKMADEWNEEDLAKLHQSASSWFNKNNSNKTIKSYPADKGLTGGKWNEVEQWLIELPAGIKENHPSTLPSVRLSFKTASGASVELTKREGEVLKLIAQGMSNKEIASELYLSSETVKKHIYRIFQKLDTHNRTETVRKAIEVGLPL